MNSKKARATPEETLALQEKANESHCKVLNTLAEALTLAGWTTIEEIFAAIDLQATTPSGAHRVIFEVKSLSEANEMHQCRAALAQLLEYRFLYGDDADCLCAVFDRPIEERRLPFLESLDICVIFLDGNGVLMCCGRLAQLRLGPFTSSVRTSNLVAETD